MPDDPTRLGKALSPRYRLVREIGEGGMATVYLAEDAKLCRKVAIKVLKPALAATIGTERFLREIRITSGLNHTNILTLIDSGLAGGFLYYVMPYVEGESLRQRLSREKQLPIDDAFRIAQEVADALGYAHSLGVVHRDIKPENILFESEHAVVTDFGVARAVTEAFGQPLTERGIAVGTPLYMSPEQASGHEEVDGRSDLYGLGCVLYEMLAGAPPFVGPNAHAIMARHQHERPPSLRVVRPTVTQEMQRLIDSVLAKVPADRPRTAEKLVVAIEEVRQGRRSVRRWVLQVAGAIGILIVAALVGRFAIGQPPALDANKVVVFPLSEAPADDAPEGTGLAVAYLIESALEHTDPLTWIDGWSQLDPELRRNPALVTNRISRRVAQARGARWYIVGALVYTSDSVTVMLRINDAIGDSVVGRASAARPKSQVAQAGLVAVNELLPRILAPDRQIDLTALSERRPAAVASWLQGEEQYRRGHFDPALAYLRRAISEDSALAVAALRGAQAASWKSLMSEADEMAELAMDNLALLPARQRDLARGLHAYLHGQADSAVQWLTRALSTNPRWTEAHMALGEVYHHLLPTVAAPLDSLAHFQFTAAAADTGFAPPLFHLAEIAIRRRDFERAHWALERFERLGGGAAERMELALMLACARNEQGGVDWVRAARDSAFAVLSAGKMLSVAGAFPRCAADAFRAVLATPEAQEIHWGAFAALQSVLAALGDKAAIVSLVDSLHRTGLWQATNAYLIDALAGVPTFESKVDVTIASLEQAYGLHYEDSLRSASLLLLGAWHARSKRLADAARLYGQLTFRAAAAPDSDAWLYAEALDAHIRLAGGDSAAALSAFEALSPAARRDFLVWGYAEPLPVERLVAAELLLSRGRYKDALHLASVFDHPSPIVYFPFLPASLALRHAAAEALARPAMAEQYRKRLTALGRMELLPE